MGRRRAGEPRRAGAVADHCGVAHPGRGRRAPDRDRHARRAHRPARDIGLLDVGGRHREGRLRRLRPRDRDRGAARLRDRPLGGRVAQHPPARRVPQADPGRRDHPAAAPDRRAEREDGAVPRDLRLSVADPGPDRLRRPRPRPGDARHRPLAAPEPGAAPLARGAPEHDAIHRHRHAHRGRSRAGHRRRRGAHRRRARPRARDRARAGRRAVRADIRARARHRAPRARAVPAHRPARTPRAAVAYLGQDGGAAVRRLRIIGLELWLPVLLVAIWWAWSASAGSTFYPPLSDIFQRFHELWLFDRVGSDVWPTLRNMLLGYGIASVAGIALGVAIARVRLLREATRPLLYFANSVPPIALIPIAIVLLGFGASTRVIVIAFSALFPTLLATVDGVRALDPVLEDVSRVTRLRWRQRFFSVVLPSAGPQIFAGMRVSLQVAFIVMISSEMLGSTQGIGFLTIQAQQSFAITDMWAGM